MKSEKIKFNNLFILLTLTIILLLSLLLLLLFRLNYKNNIQEEDIYQIYQNKLNELGYDSNTINYFLTLDEDIINFIINSEKSDTFYNILTQKYYLPKYFYDYIEYQSLNPSLSYQDTIATINTKTNYAWYSITNKTDLNKDSVILVNKYNYLEKDYVPNIVEMPQKYSYEKNYATQETINAYESMFQAAKKENIDLLITSSYRSYEDQYKTYENYKANNGIDYADLVAAHPGYSEHQTGLALDIFTPGSTMNTFHKTKAFNWLKNNSYKYGFILRYPEGKEYLTGFKAESWHYRYIGIETATKLFNENITFDEYYTYYLEN